MPAEEYSAKLKATLEGLRRVIGNPELPIVIGELPRKVFGDNFGPAKMNELLRQIAKEIPNCRIASSEGLTMKSDNLHFDSSSLRELGKRYAEKMKELLGV